MADFIFPPYPTGHDPPAYKIVYKMSAGTLFPATVCVFIYFITFAYEVSMTTRWYT